MQEFQQNTTNEQTENFNLKEELFKYLANWKWFVLGVLLALTIAFLYLRYTIPQYEAKAKILVKDDRKGGIATELSAFSDLGMFGNIASNVDNEIEVIKSSSIVEETVKELELNISYKNIGRVISAEIYKNSPIKIVFPSPSNEFSKNRNVLG